MSTQLTTDTPRGEIILYQLAWSHYCEKIRWALDHTKLPWRAVGINAFTKAEVKHLHCRKLMPVIYDPNTSTALSDSTPIMRYLEATYPHHGASLFPGSDANRRSILEWTFRLDSELGTASRRLGYARLILETPDLLFRLFIQPHYPSADLPVIRTVAAHMVGMTLMKRFQMDASIDHGIFERVETLLVDVMIQMGDRATLVGEEFSAADITLACLLRPLRIVPRVFNNPKFRPLFAWLATTLESHGQDSHLVYEREIEKKRSQWTDFEEHWQKRNWNEWAESVHGQERGETANLKRNVLYQKKSAELADNDHQPLDWVAKSSLLLPYNYFIKLRRQMWA